MKSKRLNCVVLSLLGVLLASCANKNSEQPPSGGVDGSGGNLSYIVDQSFQDWVTYDHKFFVRDLIHRLYLIQQNSPSDFGSEQKLANEFLSIKEDDFQKLAMSVQYQVVPKYCASTNHGDSDAAVTPDGKICFSYLAFRNLGVETFIPKLLSLTMHELAHLRNFSEADAQTWQLKFERGELGEKIILSFNLGYREFYKTFSKIISEAVKLGNYILSTSVDLNKSSCVQLGEVKARVEDVVFYFPYLPKYLVDELQTKIVIPFYAISCVSDSKEAIMGKLEKILIAVNGIEQKIENYENPLCQRELCSFRRNKSYNDSKVFLTEWNSKKQKFLSGVEFEKNQVSSITCELTNSEGGLIEKFSSDGNSTEKQSLHFDLTSIDDQLSSLTIEPTLYSDLEKNKNVEKTFNAFSIEVMHKGPIAITESTSFASNTLWLNGVLSQKGDRITTRFAVMDSGRTPVQSHNPNKDETKLPYYLTDPTIANFYEAPKLLRTYQLTCQLN